MVDIEPETTFTTTTNPGVRGSKLAKNFDLILPADGTGHCLQDFSENFLRFGEEGCCS